MSTHRIGLVVRPAATAGAFRLLRHLGRPAVLPGAGALLGADVVSPLRS